MQHAPTNNENERPRSRQAVGLTGFALSGTGIGGEPTCPRH